MVIVTFSVSNKQNQQRHERDAIEAYTRRNFDVTLRKDRQMIGSQSSKTFSVPFCLAKYEVVLLFDAVTLPSGFESNAQTEFTLAMGQETEGEETRRKKERARKRRAKRLG